MEYFDAPLLHAASPKNPKAFYEKLIKEIKTLHDKAGLVHADISEYNILNHKGRPMLIDFSHAVDLRYPNVQRLLRRDVHNIVRYFSTLGVALDEEKEFQRIWTPKS